MTTFTISTATMILKTNPLTVSTVTALLILAAPWLLVGVMVIGALWQAYRRHISNEKGVVLVISMLIMTVLLIMGVTFLSIALKEHQIAFNHTNYVKAFYIADGGTEMGKQMLKVTADWTTLEGQVIDCSFTQGQCEYTISDTKEDFAIVTAAVTYRKARATVRAAFNKTVIPMPPGGVTSVVGASGPVALSGNAFTIDGNNWVPPQGASLEYLSNGAAACSTPVPKFGVAVQDAPGQASVLASLSAQQLNNIEGLGGTPSVGIDAVLTQQMILDLVTALEGEANLVYPAGTQLSSQTIGTQAAPVVAVVDGDLTLNASSGAGVLIVKNGTLELKGNTDWVGMILLVGDNAKLSMSGGGDKSIYGSVIIAETTGVASEILTGSGNLKIRFSCDGLNVANYAASGMNAKQVWWTQVM